MTREIVIVDEGIGLNTAAGDQFQRILGQRFADYLFLAEAHPGIPDVEILDKLLRPEIIFLTRDRVLHMQALARGFRSYTLNEHGQLTGRPLRGVRPPKPAQSVHRELQDDYRSCCNWIRSQRNCSSSRRRSWTCASGCWHRRRPRCRCIRR